MAKSERPIEDYYDYQTAAAYAIKTAMFSGDGVMLVCVKTLMDSTEELSGHVLNILNQETTNGLTEALDDARRWAAPMNLEVEE